MNALYASFDGFKTSGNRLFSAGKYASAADVYTEAIALIPTNLQPESAAKTAPKDEQEKQVRALISVLFSNRALCHKALDRWEEVEKDATSALIVDRFNPKAHYLIGCCLCRRDEWVAGIRSLEKGEDMARRQNRPASLLAEFQSAIAMGRFEWHKASVEEDKEEDAKLLSALEHSVVAARDSALKTAVHEVEMSKSSPTRKPSLASMPQRKSVRYSVVVPPADGDPTDGVATGWLEPKPEEMLAGRVENIEKDTRSLLASLSEVFVERHQRRVNRNIPSYFVCTITFEIMLDPVITPSGHSYERAAIEKYVREIKAEDPQTRTPLTLPQLAPNLALKAAIQAFLVENPWAHPLIPYEKRDH